MSSYDEGIRATGTALPILLACSVVQVIMRRPVISVLL